MKKICAVIMAFLILPAAIFAIDFERAE